MSYSELLERAQKKYYQLCAVNKWGMRASKESSFFTDTRRCYNCDKPGHMARDCPEPRRDGIQGRTNTSGEIHRGGRGGRGGHGGRGGREGNRGRGGCRGRGGRGRNNNTSNEGSDDLRRPPRQGEPRSRSRGGRTETWCGRCGRWGNHETDNHVDQANLARDSNNIEQTQNRAGANGASTNASGDTTPGGKGFFGAGLRVRHFHYAGLLGILTPKK